MSEANTDIDRFCPGCGYDLRGISSERCPECGAPFDPNQPTEPQIPWSHRDTLGRRKAFWRTVRLATVSTKAFAGEIHRPVSLADALAFRRRVVWTAFLALALAAVVGYGALFSLHEQPWYPLDVFGSITLWLGIPVMLASVWLYLYFVTGFVSYFFHPRNRSVRQQNRAIALSYYACAPWAYLPLVSMAVVAITGAGVFGGVFESRSALLLQALAYVAIAVPPLLHLFLIWYVPQRMLHHATQCSHLRLTVMGFIAQPIGHVLCAALTVGLINLAYWGAVLLLQSFR